MSAVGLSSCRNTVKRPPATRQQQRAASTALAQASNNRSPPRPTKTTTPRKAQPVLRRETAYPMPSTTHHHQPTTSSWITMPHPLPRTTHHHHRPIASSRRLPTAEYSFKGSTCNIPEAVHPGLKHQTMIGQHRPGEHRCSGKRLGTSQGRRRKQRSRASRDSDARQRSIQSTLAPSMHTKLE